MVLCSGASEGSTGSGFGLKCLRRWGHDLKSHRQTGGARDKPDLVSFENVFNWI